MPSCFLPSCCDLAGEGREPSRRTGPGGAASALSPASPWLFWADQQVLRGALPLAEAGGRREAPSMAGQFNVPAVEGEGAGGGCSSFGSALQPPRALARDPRDGSIAQLGAVKPHLRMSHLGPPRPAVPGAFPLRGTGRQLHERFVVSSKEVSGFGRAARVRLASQQQP